MSSKKNVFEEFDKLKGELTNKLNKIKALQGEIKTSLEQDKDNKLLLKNVENMKNNITNIKSQLMKNIENSFNMVLDKVNNDINTDGLKALQEKIKKITHEIKKSE